MNDIIAPEQPSGSDLTVRAEAPEWYHENMAQTPQSAFTESDGCSIHYLLWPGKNPVADDRGLLFIHGGGSHGHWWSFLAPFFTDHYRVAAMDLSGMGDSGRREEYDAAMRSGEIAAVIEAAGLAGSREDGWDTRPIVVGHSFGGYQAMRYARYHGDGLSGLVIADSPIRPQAGPPRQRRAAIGPKRVYDSFEEAVSRFRLMPPQYCENEFLIEHIARRSLLRDEDGKWTWKFHAEAMGSSRLDEPFSEHFAALTCRRALMHGELSALVTPDVLDHMNSILYPHSPVIEIPEAQHHIALDQPLAFTAALRGLFAAWRVADAG